MTKIEIPVEYVVQLGPWYTAPEVARFMSEWPAEKFFGEASAAKLPTKGWYPVGRVVGTLIIEHSSESIKPELIASLRAQRAEVYATAEATATEIERQIQQLLAIEQKEEGEILPLPVRPEDDDIPF